MENIKLKQQLRTYIDRFVQLTEREFELFYGALIIKKLKKRELLLEKGRVCKYHFFIVHGLLRSFNYDEKGNEDIFHFAIENWWFTNVESFINESPSLFNIQALESTTILCIRKNKLEEIYNKLPQIERMFRIITEKTLIAQQKKSYFYMNGDSKTRYYHLVNTIPDFAQRVPQYMIASYLNITPEYLSELRKLPR